MIKTAASRPTFDRRALGLAALRAATDLRTRHDIPDNAPVCPFDLAQAEGVSVRFVDVSMEGIYYKGAPSRILLSARRPWGRRVFNGGHELGHHVFGHGSRLDELHDRSEMSPWDDPDEFAADTFASHLLMPTIGIRYAMNRREWSVADLTPLRCYALASDFGVGYATLVNHLHFGIGAITRSTTTALLRTTPSEIRAALIGKPTSEHVVLVSPKRASAQVDVEVGALLLVPSFCGLSTRLLSPIGAAARGALVQALLPGQTSIPVGDRSILVRISPAGFVGLAKYRHLETLDDEA